MADIKKELDRIKGRISDANFLANKGLSNEVGIHVFTYDPKHELIVRDYIERLINTPSDDYRIIERDMYKIMLEILEEKRVLNTVPSLEKKKRQGLPPCAAPEDCHTGSVPCQDEVRAT